MNEIFVEDDVVNLARAIDSGDLEGIESAVRSGASPNAVGDRGGSKISLLEFALMRNEKASFSKLLELGADPNLRKPGGGEGTVLHLVAMNSDSDWLEMILANRGDPNVEDSRSETPIFYTLSGENYGNLDLLLKSGADLNHADHHGETVLLREARIRQWQNVIRLLERGADWRKKNTSGVGLPELVARGQASDPGIEADRQRVIRFLGQRGITVQGTGG